MLYVVIESWLNEQATDENRGSMFSAYIFINMTVLAVGQQMLLLDDPGNLALFALVAVLVSLASVPVLMSTGPSNPARCWKKYISTCAPVPKLAVRHAR